MLMVRSGIFGVLALFLVLATAIPVFAAEPVSVLEQSMSETLDLWREGRYEQLFERLAHRGRTSREVFVKKMRDTSIRPACCWQKMENFRVLNEKRTEATVYVKVGLEGTAAPSGSSTREFKLTHEEGIWKMPEKLRRDLANPKVKWIIFINPPFATAQQGGATGANKADVAKTKIRNRMHLDDLGEVSRELFAQFLYRIRREFRGKTAWLGLFSKLKYINATNDQKFRDSIFQYPFRRGFMFSSVNFSGTSRTGQFPVGFLLWDLKRTKLLEDQEIVVDVFNTKVEKTGTKLLPSEHRDQFLSKWIDRPAGIAVFPPFSSAITVKSTGPDIRDRISADFLGSLMCAGNDVQHQNMTAIFSGPYASAGGLSITPDNFEKAMVVHAVRRLPKAEWHNDRDQFMQPSRKLPDTFVHDCVVWSLFSNSNNTVAMRDVSYGAQTYQVHNHFFPIQLKALKKWTISDSEIRVQLTGTKDRFVAHWLDEHEFSEEARALLWAGEAVYKLYFAHLNALRTSLVRAETWDAGWWQIRKALSDQSLATDEMLATKVALDTLRQKLLPQLESFGFLSLGQKDA